MLQSLGSLRFFNTQLSFGLGPSSLFHEFMSRVGQVLRPVGRFGEQWVRQQFVARCMPQEGLSWIRQLGSDVAGAAGVYFAIVIQGFMNASVNPSSKSLSHGKNHDSGHVCTHYPKKPFVLRLGYVPDLRPQDHPVGRSPPHARRRTDSLFRCG